MYVKYTYLKLSCLLLGFIHYTCGQGTIGTTDPCLGQLTVRAGSQFTDNLSCPRIAVDSDDVLRCISRDDLCNGNETCTGGTDEGQIISALDCDGDLSSMFLPIFVCTPGENIFIDSLCDGLSDCSSGDDETSLFCENKCLVPYYGGCPYTRECISTDFDVSCGTCLDGFVPDPASPRGECLSIIFVTLQEFVYTVNEDDPSVRVCAEVSNPMTTEFSPGEILTVTLQATPVSATPPVDFINITPVDFQFNSTQLIDCIDIPIVDDAIREGDEIFLVSLSTNNSRIQISPVAIANVVITDDERISFELQTQDVNEAAGIVQACVELTSPPFGLLRDVQVDIRTVSVGSATAFGVDYTRVTTTLSYPMGSIGFVRCISIGITNDLLVEDTESFQVSVSSDPDVVFNPPSGSAIIGIQDNDFVDICLQQPTINTVSEDVGSHQECVEITSPPGRLAKNVSLLLTTSNGSNVETSAQDPLDYIGGNQMITFTPTNQNDTLCVDIPIIDDVTCGESVESFFIHLMSNDSSISANIALCTGTIIILDNDGTCGLSSGVALGIAVTICSLFCFIGGLVCGGMIGMFMGKKQAQHGPESRVSSPQPVYEVIDNTDAISATQETIELRGNIAYGPFRQNL